VIAIQDRIRRLIDSQSYAVLCTQGQAQPYGSLVTFAASDDLKNIIFSTPVATRKFRLLSECENVALVVDSRSISAHDLMQIEAVTATGLARIVERGPDFDRWSSLLIDRHAHLASFVRDESSAFCASRIVRYFHVAVFRRWSSGRRASFSHRISCNSVCHGDGFCPTSLLAHVPAYVNNNNTLETASHVSEPEKSWVKYGELEGGGDTRWFSCDFNSSEPMAFELFISPDSDPNFVPKLAIAGPGITSSGSVPRG